MLTPEEARHPQMREVPADYWNAILDGVTSQLVSTFVVLGPSAFRPPAVTKLAEDIMRNTGLRRAAD